ncbi:MAG TPA: hypothetical protein VME43_20125 [Bryobacteraceae bacterium]|nr:hypothetical protein [Bryobacteraceae bacterium]
MSDWLELELAHRLPPVEAPEELWERVESGLAAAPAMRCALRGSRRARARRSSLWMAWPVAAMATVALAAGALWLADMRYPALDIRQLAARESGQSAPLDLHTSDPREIRRWLRDHAGLDVPLPSATSVKLEGARMVQNGKHPVAAVQYRVGRYTVTLLVARADPHHPFPPHGARAAAWQARDQVYALAGANPDHAEAACQLCHASL